MEFEKPSHRHSTLCVLTGVSDNCLWERGKAKAWCNYFWPQNSANSLRKFGNYMLHVLIYKPEVEKNAFRLDILSYPMYRPKCMLYFQSYVPSQVHSFTYWIDNRGTAFGTPERQLRSNLLTRVVGLCPVFFLSSQFFSEGDNFIATWQNSRAGSPSCSRSSCLWVLII